MKKAPVDFNNLNDKKRKNDHLYSDILGAEPRVSEMRSPECKKGNNDWQSSDIKQ